MNNYNFTQSLDGLNNIEADNVNTSNLNVGSLIVDTAEITTLSDCNLINCTAETPLNTTSVVNKTYVDTNFLDRTNNLTQNINGLKTFTNNTNFSASLLARTNLTLYDWDNQTGNTLTLTFPMKQTIALRVSSGTTMSVQLPALSTNERGMIFTFIKLSSNVNITLTTGGLNNIYTLNALGTNTTTNTTLLSDDKVMTTLAVGFYGALTYWIEVSPYSTFDRDQNNLLYARLASPNAFTNTNTFTPTGSPTSPMFEISTLGAIIRYSLRLNDGNGSFFSELYNNGIVCHINNRNTSGTINFTTKDGGGNPSNPIIISSASTTIYSNLVSNSQATFNNLTPICSVASPTANNHLTRKDYVDNTFLDRVNNLTQNINGLKTFTDDLTVPNIYCNTALYFRDINLGLNKALIFHQADIVYFDTLTVFDNYWKFKCFNIEQVVISQLSSTFNNKLISLAQARFDNFTPSCTVATPTQINHLTRKDYVDTNFVDRTNNLMQNINGLKTFTDTTTFTSGLKTDSILVNNNNINFGICLANTNTSIRVGNASNSLTIETPRITLKPSSNTYSSDIEQSGVNFFIKNNNLNGTLDFRVSTNAVVLLLDAINTTISNNLISNSQATFNNICPISNTNASLTNHLTTLGFNNNKYIDFITDQTITGTKRLSNFFCTALNITPTSGGSGNRQQIYMTGTELAFVPQFNNNNYAFYCKDSVPTQTKPLNINSVSTTISNLLVSNNITGPSTTGTNNIYTNLISGGIINIGSTSSSCNFDSIPTFNSDATFVGNIFSETAVYFKDIGIGSQLNQARIFKQDDYLYFDTNINYTNGYSFRTSSNDTLTITSALTTINNGLTSNAQSTFNNFTPICSVASPTANNHLVRKDYCDNNFMNLTTGQTKSGTVNFLNQITFNGGSGGGTAINCNNGLNANTVLNVAGQANFNGGAVFNTTLPTTTISATTANQLVNYTTLTSQGFITSSSILSANNSFTGFNTFTNGLTIRSTLLLKDFTNTQQGTIDLGSAILSISCDVNSGKVQINTHDSGGSSYNRVIINENEFNLTVPITLFLDYTYYNPVNFTSTRLGYSMSNTGSTNTLTNNVANNSGQINIPAGSWNITYTGTITVITNAITTLTSLEIYVADNLTNDLNIIGINVINYYQLSSVPIGRKMRISGSGNYISYVNTSTELNLRLLPLFTAGTGGLNFQGKISATRNA